MLIERRYVVREFEMRESADETQTSYTQTHTTVFTARPNFSTVYKTVA